MTSPIIADSPPPSPLSSPGSPVIGYSNPSARKLSGDFGTRTSTCTESEVTRPVWLSLKCARARLHGGDLTDTLPSYLATLHSLHLTDNNTNSGGNTYGGDKDAVVTNVTHFCAASAAAAVALMPLREHSYPPLYADCVERRVLCVCQWLDQLRAAHESPHRFVSPVAGGDGGGASHLPSLDVTYQLLLVAMLDLLQFVCVGSCSCCRCSRTRGEKLSRQLRQRVELTVVQLLARLDPLPLTGIDTPSATGDSADATESAASTGCTAAQLYLHSLLNVHTVAVCMLFYLSGQDDYTSQAAAVTTAEPMPWIAAEDAVQPWLAAAHHLIWQLCRRAAHRCHHNQLRHCSPASAAAAAGVAAFSCRCEKAVWRLLMQLLADRRLEFWRQLNTLFEYRLSNSGGGGGSGGSGGGGGTEAGLSHCQSQLQWAERWPLVCDSVWVGWLMVSLSDVFRYSLQWRHLAGERSPVPANYSLLVSLVQRHLAADGVSAECSWLLLISCRLSGQWGCCDRLLQLVWQRLWAQLTLSSGGGGGAPQQQQQQRQQPLTLSQLAAIVPASSGEWLATVQWRRHQATGGGGGGIATAGSNLSQHMSQLLRAQLGDDSGASAADRARCWRALAGRMFVRLHARRAAEMSLPALVAVVSLLLTACQLRCGEPRVDQRLLAFLSQLTHTERPSHAALVVRAHFALIRLLVFDRQRPVGGDASGAVAAIAGAADRAMRAAVGEKRVWSGLTAFLDECDAAFALCERETDDEAAAALSVQTLLPLMTDGWRAWLVACGAAERVRCLAVLTRVARLTALFTPAASPLRLRLRPLVSCVQQLCAATPSQHAQQQQQQSTSDEGAWLVPPPELAQLAVWLTLTPEIECRPRALCSDTAAPHFTAPYLTQLLMASPDFLVDTSCRHLTVVLTTSRLSLVYDSTRTALLQEHHRWLVHEWLRCFVLTPPGGAGAAVARLTHLLAQLSPLHIIVPDSAGAAAAAAAEVPTLVDRFAANLRQLCCSEGGSNSGTAASAAASSSAVAAVNEYIGSLNWVRWWARGAGGKSAALVAHVYCVLARLVRDLIDLLEHQKIVLIVNTLLLPPPVYDRARVQARGETAAVAAVFPLFMAAFDSMLFPVATAAATAAAAGASVQSRPFYIRCVRDLIVCYAHRFALNNSDGAMHPLAELLSAPSSVSVQFKQLVLQQCNTALLYTKGAVQTDNIARYARLLLLVVSDGRRLAVQAEQLVRLVAAECASPLLDILVTLQEPAAKRAVTNLVAALADRLSDSHAHPVSDHAHSPVGSAPVLAPLADSLSGAVSALAERHMAFSSAAVMRVLQVMCVLAAPLMRKQFGAIESLVRQIEVKRGVGLDTNMRRGLVQMRQRLGID